MRLLHAMVIGFALLPACSPVTEPQVTKASLLAGGPPFLRADPRLSVAHVGTRRFEFPQTAGQASTYRERITTDGQGRFALEPLQPHAVSTDEWNEFELRQRVRQGFLFRYRDFLVRDAELFATNWESIDLQRTESVAGRSCAAYRIESSLGAPAVFELLVDQETGLILASREYDAEGRLVADMAYETLRLDPDLTSVVWHQASNAEQVVASVDGLAEELQLEVLRPRLLPNGYAPLEVATVEDGEGQTWLKHTYSDGLEPLFFLQALVEPPQLQWPDQGLGGEKLPAPSSVIVFELGSATAIQGSVEGFRLMVIGKVREAELLDLIESSLP